MFPAEVNQSLVAAASLLNSSVGTYSAQASPDTLQEPAQLASYLAEQDPVLQWRGVEVNPAEVKRVRALRGQLAQVWGQAPEPTDETLEVVNRLLEGVGTRLVRERLDDGTYAVEEEPVPASPRLADVMTAAIVGALCHLIVADEMRRLRICKGDGCEAAIIDLTRNRSKLFCDFGNCANRAHVRAYRARKAKAKGKAKRAKQAEAAQLSQRAEGAGLSGVVGSAGPVEPAEQAEARLGNERGERRRELKKPSAAEKADSINYPTSASAMAAKEFRDQRRDALMAARKKSKKKKHKGKN